MTMRTTNKTVTFRRPFFLKGVDRLLPPADYRVMTDEELIEGLRSHASDRQIRRRSLEQASLGLHDQDCDYGAGGRPYQPADVGNDEAPVPPHAGGEKDRLVGLVSIGDLVKIQLSEVEMEAAATREYTA